MRQIAFNFNCVRAETSCFVSFILPIDVSIIVYIIELKEKKIERQPSIDYIQIYFSKGKKKY